MPSVFGKLLRGTFWMTLRTPLQAVFAFWVVRLMVQAIGKDAYGAYAFAWGFGFLQFLFEFGMGSALQRRIAETWTLRDRAGIDHAVSCGLSLYAAVALAQSVALLAIAYLALPYSHWGGASYQLIVKLLWLQVLTAPFHGLAMVVSSVLQGARRYDVIPRLEFLIVILRFAILFFGLRKGYDFFLIVAAQNVAGIALSLGPGLWVVVRELGYVPKFRAVGPADFAVLLRLGFAMSMIQLSVVLSDKMDTTILGFALADPGPATAVYAIVSKPFLQVRQIGWMLSSLMMPAAASLIAAGDAGAIERLKYDGSRLLIGLLLPVALLAWIYAAPFLSLWVGGGYADQAPLMRLFLIAALPLVLTILVQIAIASGRLGVIGASALAGALVNLPLSYYLTTKIGVAGVIWGSVLTVLISNVLVPGVYLFRVLNMRPGTFLARALSAPLWGAAALLAATSVCRAVLPPDPPGGGDGLSMSRAWPLLANLLAGTLAYAAGYRASPRGRSDFGNILRRLLRSE